MTTVVLVNATEFVGTTNLPSAQGNRGVNSTAAEASSAIIDQLAQQKVNVSPTENPNHSVAFQKGFYGDYFNRVYVIPPVLSLIDPVLGAANKFVFWNTHFDIVSITNIAASDNDGLTTDITLPLQLGAIKLTSANIFVDDAAPNEEDAHYKFTLSSGDYSLWTVSLLRTNLLAVSPETPVVEVLKWKTAVDAARDGTEQRSTISQFTRIEYQVNYLFLEDADQKTFYEQLTTQLNGSFSYPIWTEQTRLLAVAPEGEANIQIDTSKFDVQAGDQLYFLGADETKTESVKVFNIAQDGVTVVLQSGLLSVWTPDDRIFRVTTVKIQDKPSMNRGAYGYSEAKITLRQMEFRDLYSPGIAPVEIARTTEIGDRVLTGDVFTLDTIPIVHARPIVDGESKIDFDWSFDIIDYDIGTFDFLTDRQIASVVYDRKFYCKNLLQKFYWNWMLTWMHGQRRPVWLPTWENDVGPDVFTLAGSTLVTVSEKFAAHYPNDNSHRGLWIAYKDGHIARRIVEIGTDSTGHTVIALDTAIPDDFPQVGPYDIGFLILARQATDEVQREWHPAYNFLSTSFVSTKTTPEIT